MYVRQRANGPIQAADRALDKNCVATFQLFGCDSWENNKVRCISLAIQLSLHILINN